MHGVSKPPFFRGYSIQLLSFAEVESPASPPCVAGCAAKPLGMKRDITAENNFPLFGCLMNCDFEMKSKPAQLKQIHPNSDKTLLRVVLSV